MQNLKKDLVYLLKKNQVIKFGKFTLSSGQESDYYVDMKRAITHPQTLSLVAKIIKSRLDKDVDKVAGPALGAIPIVTAVSLEAKLPMLMIRKSRKNYGTTELIEGDIRSGEKVVVVEDVTTTGNSLLKAIEILRDNQMMVNKAFAIVDRDEGAIENLKKKGVILEPLISIEDFHN